MVILNFLVSDELVDDVEELSANATASSLDESSIASDSSDCALSSLSDMTLTS